MVSLRYVLICTGAISYPIIHIAYSNLFDAAIAYLLQIPWPTFPAENFDSLRPLCFLQNCDSQIVERLQSLNVAAG